ncbi:MAG TPA: HAD-IIB family hydrolase [Polyangiaceae bacterium]|nr:HAD-IIB family hydrolase [Polyangiaceae bacterium]HMR75526.1 HAD-IIB family hydrolase [Polyangiaceae bacterium]
MNTLSPADAKALRGVLFDLDDTLLDHGRLTENAYRTLFRLREAQLELVAVTGRPALWGELLCRQWPVLGAITENGNISFARVDGRVRRMDPLGDAVRAERTLRLQTLAEGMSREFPELQAADDNGARCSDFTFDIGEHRQVDDSVVRSAMDFARARGAKTQRSSVHLHVTFDRHDKASGALLFLRSVAKEDPTVARARYAFIGDSENDAACFAAFKHSAAVANLRGRPSMLPRYLADRPRSAGFEQFATQLISARNA